MKGDITIESLQAMKRAGRKIVGVVVYDYQMAQVVDRAGVDIVSVGDSVGVTMWGHRSELEVTLDQMLVVCQAVTRGVNRALVSCDMPYGPMQKGPDGAVDAARRLVNEGGAAMVKVDAASEHLDGVAAIVRAGIPVWAQFGITPHTAAKYGGMQKAGPELSAALIDTFLAEARGLESAGASMLDFTNSGPVAGPAVTEAAGIPVIGGLGGGPWLDGRIRGVAAAIGYLAAALDDAVERYANVARTALDAVEAYASDVRAGDQIRGQRK